MDRNSVIAVLREERDALDRAIQILEGGMSGNEQQTLAKPARKRGGKRRLSAEARQKMADAQKRRWAKVNKAKPEPAAKPSGKRRISAAGIEKIRAAAKARWAKIRKAKAAGK